MLYVMYEEIRTYCVVILFQINVHWQGYLLSGTFFFVTCLRSAMDHESFPNIVYKISDSNCIKVHGWWQYM
jgi:hypothetical protein